MGFTIFNEEQSLLALAINSLPSLNCENRVSLFCHLQGKEDWDRLTLFELEWITGKHLPVGYSFSPKILFDQVEKSARHHGIPWINVLDQRYPKLLREIHDPPFLLFYRGDLECLNRDSAAIVGTRHPSLSALKETYRMSLELSSNGLTVVSGLAMGTDTAAHEGALDGVSPTAAVLGGSVDVITPGQNRILARRILEDGGCLVGEFPPGTEIRPYHFPRRNRIISGLVPRVLISQAPARSGALITADFALDQGRDVFVLFCGTESPDSAGSYKLWEEGARLVTSIIDINEIMLGETPPLIIKEVGQAENGLQLARQMEKELSGLYFQKYGGGFEYAS